MVKIREKFNTNLTHVCRDCWNGEKIKYIEFLANTVAFISCRLCRHLQLMKATVWMKALYILSFHRVLSTPAMSTNVDSDRCHTLPFFLTFFIISPFQIFFYININQDNELDSEISIS